MTSNSVLVQYRAMLLRRCIAEEALDRLAKCGTDLHVVEATSKEGNAAHKVVHPN